MALPDAVHASWREALASQDDNLARIGSFLREESAAGRAWHPSGQAILRAFEQPLGEVRVLVLGQDPYPTPGHAVGLSFSVDSKVRPLPRSLQNILKERTSDLGLPIPESGDLSSWSRQGVLLLNRVLTVQSGRPGSHRGRGWEEFTAAAIEGLSERGGPLVAVLWGRDAQTAAPLLEGIPLIASAHPSPMSADRGFFGSKPFSRANALLEDQGATPIDWGLG